MCSSAVLLPPGDGPPAFANVVCAGLRGHDPVGDARGRPPPDADSSSSDSADDDGMEWPLPDPPSSSSDGGSDDSSGTDDDDTEPSLPGSDAPPPECVDCGARHGAPGAPAACLPREPHADGQRKRVHEVGPHFLGVMPGGLPPRTGAGRATDAQNACLIHTLLQLVDPSPDDAPGGRWADEVRRSVAVRATLAAADPSVADGGFLGFAEQWQPILAALGKHPAEYRVVCYSPHGSEAPGRGYCGFGTGPTTTTFPSTTCRSRTRLRRPSAGALAFEAPASLTPLSCRA